MQYDDDVISVYLVCPSSYDVIGGGCYRTSNESVETAFDCLEKCLQGMPGEIDNKEKLDALKLYVDAMKEAVLRLGK